MGVTRVDLRHLLEDLRDAYPGTLEETILVEIVANSLDSGACSIEFSADPEERTFTVVDDGRGMSRRELIRYHDLAATGKQRGKGIGFAGVGIKLGLLAAEEVVTETRTTRIHAATTWHLASRYRAPWNWIDVGPRLPSTGTAVVLHLSNPLSPLLDPGYIESVVLDHYRTLFEPELDEILAGWYPGGVGFVVNGSRIPELAGGDARVPVRIRLKGKRKPSGAGYLELHDEPVSEFARGVAVSTLGKVITQGWDWLGLTPAIGDRVSGLVEIPTLAECLTLNKSDFLRTGPLGATYLTYRKVLQEVVGTQLEAWGMEVEEPPARRPRTRPLERDLENMLVDLARSYPLLAALVESRSGGQRKIPLGDSVPRAVAGDVPGAGMLAGVEGEAAEGDAEPPLPGEVPPAIDEGREPAVPPEEEAVGTIPSEAALPSRRRRRAPGRYGLRIEFETRPDEQNLARLVESTILVNEAHPAYRRAVASRSQGYHLALCVVMALAPLAVEPEQSHTFITDFMTRWGRVAGKSGRSRR